MSTTTPNLGLVKPATDGSELFDIVVVNQNYDKIDATLPVQTTKVATTTVGNTTTETVLHTHTIAAGSAVLGSAYQLRLWGSMDNVVTAVPTLTLRARIGGLSGTLLTSVVFTAAATAQTNRSWKAILDLICLNPGGSATWQALLDAGVMSPTTGTAVASTTSAITRDSTVSQAVVLTAQWSAANAANVLRCDAGWSGRVTNF